MIIHKTLEFAASHYLPKPYKGKCSNMHGHNYKIEVEFFGMPNKLGFLIDFSKIKKAIMNKYDHKCLNQVMKKAPTAEHIAYDIYHLLADKFNTSLSAVSRVRVYETEDSWAEV